MTTIKRAAALTPAQLRHVVRVTDATSRSPERDCLAILFTHCTGVRVTELARLEVRDILLPGGALRDEVQLRAATTKNCRARVIFLTNPKLRAAIERWLAFRLARDLGCELQPAEYRGLAPYTRVLLTHKGAGFELTCKTRTLPHGRVVDYWAADALEARFRDLYRAAGMKTSSHSGRRSFASALMRKGVTIEQTAILLGHADEDVTAGYIEIDRCHLRQMYDAAI